MVFSSVAIVAGVATLTSSLFKSKELRARDIIDLSRIDIAEIGENPQLKIVQNDINAHITGVKDPVFHAALIEIMAQQNKPVGYFFKLDGRLFLSSPYQISIVKQNKWLTVKKQIINRNSAWGSLAYIIGLTIILSSAIELDASTEAVSYMKAIAIILAGLSGVIFYHFVLGLSVQWNQNTYDVKNSEYQSIFDEYAMTKAKLLTCSEDSITQGECIK